MSPWFLPVLLMEYALVILVKAMEPLTIPLKEYALVILVHLMEPLTVPTEKMNKSVVNLF